MDRHFTKIVALAAVVVALLLGLLVGVTTGIADRIFGGP
jgi:ABC-type dipeptide/oligopeptide/nickel transport system permease subunit